MINEKMKNCFDCLHCKVSSESTEDCRLCFCSQTKKKVKHKDNFWLNKKPCDDFFDLSEKPMTILNINAVVLLPTYKRKPLLRRKK